jgi:hypothetical protein
VADLTVDHVRVLRDEDRRPATQASQVVALNEQVDGVRNSVDGLTKPLP